MADNNNKSKFKCYLQMKARSSKPIINKLMIVNSEYSKYLCMYN